jgi:DNA-binding SARP family transcriptional activator/pimeloyl-ACP methyl ester carboxylesterase
MRCLRSSRWSEKEVHVQAIVIRDMSSRWTPDAQDRRQHQTRPAVRPIRLELFGTPKIYVGSTEVATAIKRGLALLGYLAHSARPTPRARMAVLLWPDCDEPIARARLRRLLYTLEELIGSDLFDSSGDTLALNPARVSVDTIDFARFAQRLLAGEGSSGAGEIDDLQALVEVGSRPLLHGVSYGSDEFDDWIRAQTIDHEHRLAHLLRRLIDLRMQRGESAAAIGAAEKLIRLDPYSEPAYVLLMRVHAGQGNAAGVENTYMRCAEALRGEFGIKPGPKTEEAYLEILAAVKQPAASAQSSDQHLALRFAESPNGTVAYATIGSGPQTLLVVSSFMSHIDIAWEDPSRRRVLQALATRFKVVLFDRRGVGLSERLGADATAEMAVGDALTVLDHEGIDRAWLFGTSEGGFTALRLAAEHPQRVAGLMLFGTAAKGSWAEDHPWAPKADAFGEWLESWTRGWGNAPGIGTFAPSVAEDPSVNAWWARMSRQAVSPAILRTVIHHARDTDVRALLPSIKVPTLVMHRKGDRVFASGAGEYLARHIDGARFVALEGNDHWWWRGDREEMLRNMISFAQGSALPQ